MRDYGIMIDCDVCGEVFEASRYDAKFCSPRCRTAHHRTKKRREKAGKTMLTSWDRLTVNTYDQLLIEHPNADGFIKEIAANHGTEAAGAATRLAYHLVMNTISRMEKRIQQKDEAIQRLKEMH